MKPLAVSTPTARPFSTRMPVTSQCWMMSTPRCRPRAHSPRRPRRGAPCRRAAAAGRPWIGKRALSKLRLGTSLRTPSASEQLGVDAVQPHRVAARARGVALRIRMVEVEHAALAHHGVVVDVLLQPFPELQRPFVEGDVAGLAIVGADDRGVAPDIARADIAALDHSDIGDAVLLGEVIGGRQPMPAAAHDDDIIFGLGLRLAPDRFPACVALEGLGEDREDRVAQDEASKRRRRTNAGRSPVAIIRSLRPRSRPSSE